MPRARRDAPIIQVRSNAREPITIADIEAMRQLIAAHHEQIPFTHQILDWKPWQQQIAAEICEHDYNNLQGWRQEIGKSTIACLFGMEYIRRGIPVITAFPTLRQGGRVILRRLDHWTKAVQVELGLKRTADNQMEIVWDNGGALMALSTDESAKAGTQGYTAGLIITDEAHEASPDAVIGPMYPACNIAMSAGYGKIIQLGVGGDRLSLGEHCKRLKRDDGTPLFHQIHFSGSRIVAAYPEMLPQYTRDKALYSLEQFDQFVECKPVRAGARLLFPRLLEECPEVPGGGGYLVGIDVGKREGKRADPTVAMRMRVGASSVQEQSKTFTIDDIYTLPQGLLDDEQAQLIVEWAQPWRNRILPYAITVETNGIGRSLHEALRAYWPDCGGMDITDDARNRGHKSELINELRMAAQNSCFAVAKDLRMNDRGELAYDHFSSLAFDRDEKGHDEWPHSDYLSAALMCIAGI
jgi:hypothetical protein